MYVIDAIIKMHIHKPGIILKTTFIYLTKGPDIVFDQLKSETTLKGRQSIVMASIMIMYFLIHIRGR